ncbi:MAG TPA: LPS assembly lipoprotein LptE [Bryobacteraceae bacterium]|nr:LPS assembly lipoprotein LptE [Bryobacteraceae bacterium]
MRSWGRMESWALVGDRRQGRVASLPYLLVLALLTGCGYHVTGHGDTLPKTLNTIAIPAFGNTTTRQTLARLLAADTTREFISRTRFKIMEDPNQADAVLHGILTEFSVNPIIFDPKSGRATTVHVRATIQISLVERATGKTIVSRPNMQWDERYEVNVNPQAYFDESGTAIRRVSQSMARAVVSTILENF